MRSISRSSLSALALVASAMISLNANAQQQCSEKLLEANVEINFSKSEFRAFFREIICSSSKEQFVKKYGVQTGGNYLQTYSGMANVNIDDYETIQRQHCGNITEAASNSALAYSSVSVVPTGARALYVQCLRGQEFACDLAPGTDAPVVMVYYNPPGIKETRVGSVDVTNGQVRGIAKGDVFNQGTRPISVAVTTTPFRLTLELVQGGDHSRACTVYLPPPPPEMSCLAYMRAGRTGDVACSRNTDPGYYWKKAERVSRYFTAGFSPVGGPVPCNSSQLNKSARSIRYPPAPGHDTFLEPHSGWTPNEVNPPGEFHSPDVQCNTIGGGIKVSNDDNRPICGQFEFVCSKQ
jgi:hypothetical protein